MVLPSPGTRLHRKLTPGSTATSLGAKDSEAVARGDGRKAEAEGRCCMAEASGSTSRIVEMPMVVSLALNSSATTSCVSQTGEEWSV